MEKTEKQLLTKNELLNGDVAIVCRDKNGDMWGTAFNLKGGMELFKEDARLGLAELLKRVEDGSIELE